MSYVRFGISRAVCCISQNRSRDYYHHHHQQYCHILPFSIIPLHARYHFGEGDGGAATPDQAWPGSLGRADEKTGTELKTTVVDLHFLKGFSILYIYILYI